MAEETRRQGPDEAARWQRVWEIFDHVLALPSDERGLALDDLCAGDDDLRREVESLVAAHDEDSLLAEKPLAGVLPTFVESGLGTPEIDRYRLLEPLGSGGMGQVFAARRADRLHDQVVAVKVLRRGLDTEALIRRFRSERRILARLSHPHIARLLDGGSTRDGRPYLVMEKVDGTRIDDYCEEGELSLRQRLRLFQQVCRAVHFAHRNLVVHRDLKPGNILITRDGEPKLLDFGIAKLLEPATSGALDVAITEPGKPPMTPQYASPEQLRGQDATTASDVYSLGLLLYQLLTGALPYRLTGVADPVRVVCDSALERPSRRVRGAEPHEADGEARPARWAQSREIEKTLRGDLDNIVLKALAKAPEERYASAEALAEDIDRYCRGLPVSARADSLGYRAGKFVRRHRLAVGLGAAVLGALLVLLAVLLVQRRQILDERDRVLEEHRRATFVSDFLVELFASPDPTRAEGESLTARQLLERGLTQIESDQSFEPRSRSALLLSMGRSLAGLGLYDEALPYLERSLELRRRLRPRDDGAIAEALIHTGEVLSLAGHYERASPLLRRALALRLQSPAPDDRRLAEAHFHLGYLLVRRGKLAAADSELEAAEGLARSAAAQKLLARILDRRATLLQERGRLEEAEALFDESLVLRRRIYGEKHVWVALSLNNSGLLAAERGELERAERHYREAEQMQRRLFGGDHPQLATTLINRGLLAARRADAEAAESLLSEALDIYRRTLGPVHPKVAGALGNLASLELSRQQLDLAQEHYREALAVQEETLGRAHFETANTQNNLAHVLALRGRLDDAEPLFRQALETFRRILGAEHPRVGATLGNLAEIALQRGDFEESRAIFEDAVAILRRSPGDVGSQLAATLSNLAAAERGLGDLDAAVATGTEAVAEMRRAVGDRHPGVAMTLVRLASLQAEAGEMAEAAAAAEEALDIFRHNPAFAEGWIEPTERILAVAGGGPEADDGS